MLLVGVIVLLCGSTGAIIGGAAQKEQKEQRPYLHAKPHAMDERERVCVLFASLWSSCILLRVVVRAGGYLSDALMKRSGGAKAFVIAASQVCNLFCCVHKDLPKR